MTRGERLADPDVPESYLRVVWLILKSSLKEPRVVSGAFESV